MSDTGAVKKASKAGGSSKKTTNKAIEDTKVSAIEEMNSTSLAEIMVPCWYRSYGSEGEKVNTRLNPIGKIILDDLKNFERIKISTATYRDVEGMNKAARAKGTDLKAYKRWFKNAQCVQMFPSVAEFTKGVKKDQVSKHSGLFSYDIENLSDETVELLKKDKHIVTLAQSMGGAPNYWCLLYNPNATVKEHADYWRSGEAYLRSTYTIPKSDDIHDVNRVRCLAYDPNAYFNPNAVAFVYTPMGFERKVPDTKSIFTAYLSAPPGQANRILCAEAFYLGGLFAGGSTNFKSHAEAVEFITAEISKRNVDDIPAAIFQFDEGIKKPIKYLGPTNEVVYNEIALCLSVRVNNQLIPIDGKTLAEMWLSLPKKDRGGFETYKRVLLARAKRVHPWTAFFDQKKWDGVDRFAELKKYITIRDKGWDTSLKKHMIRGIEQIFGDEMSAVNRYVFTLQGGYHIGKSTLVAWLTLAGKLTAFSGEPDLEDHKELKRIMTNHANVIWEEVDSMTRNEVKQLKALISLKYHTVRPLFLDMAKDMKRLASLWATVNDVDFLTRTEYRWLVFTVSKINLDELIANIDPLDLWLQAKAEYDENKRAGWLDASERITMENTAQEYVYYSPTEQLLQETFVGDKSTKPLSVNEIGKEINTSDHKIPVGLLGIGLMKVFGKYRYTKKRYEGRQGAFYHIKIKPPEKKKESKKKVSREKVQAMLAAIKDKVEVSKEKVSKEKVPF
jgi:hypothetical protein